MSAAHGVSPPSCRATRKRASKGINKTDAATAGWAAELACDYRGHKVERIADNPVLCDFGSTVLFLNDYCHLPAY